MFRKLRLKLMLVNLSVILLLFLLLITGTYFFVQDRMADGREHLINRMSHDLISGKFTDSIARRDSPMNPPPYPPPDHGPGPGPMVFFVKVNQNNEILQTSPFMPLTANTLSLLINKIPLSEQNNGEITLNKNEYFYQLATIPGEQDFYIIIQDLQRDRTVLKELITGLSLTGIVCMILSLFGSLFMANRAMVPIEKSWQQQKDFLADASHEFRTPLAVIQTNLEIVRDNPGETVASQDHWLSNIYEETICMTKLVESLLFLARADSHQQLLSKDVFLLNQAVITAVDLLRPIADLKRITLTTQAKTDILYYADEGKLRQVISILLDNALRHTPESGTIQIHLTQLQHEISLSIADTGEGISSVLLEKIFERFYQSDISRAQGGAGLGLSIAKWIIESHNGHISVNSELGKGTTFRILLPHL